MTNKDEDLSRNRAGEGAPERAVHAEIATSDVPSLGKQIAFLRSIVTTYRGYGILHGYTPDLRTDADMFAAILSSLQATERTADAVSSGGDQVPERSSQVGRIGAALRSVAAPKELQEWWDWCEKHPHAVESVAKRPVAVIDLLWRMLGRQDGARDA